jgi:hypothetical protein
MNRVKRRKQPKADPGISDAIADMLRRGFLTRHGDDGYKLTEADRQHGRDHTENAIGLLTKMIAESIGNYMESDPIGDLNVVLYALTNAIIESVMTKIEPGSRDQSTLIFCGMLQKKWSEYVPPDGDPK